MGKQNKIQNQGRPMQKNHEGDKSMDMEGDFNLRETKPSLGGGRLSGNDRGNAFDLVEQMNYLYVRVVKARELPRIRDPFVEVKLGGLMSCTRCCEKTFNPEWNQVFSVFKDNIQASYIEISVKERVNNGDDLIGTVVFDALDLPRRVPPDSPLAPEWYHLDNLPHDRVKGELMLAVWMGTQADEAFADAWHMDANIVNGDVVTGIRSKVYLSPRMWYLRVNVIEAQELLLTDRNRQHPELFVKAIHGNMVLRNRISQSRSPHWNEDLMFVVAEPVEDRLILSVEERTGQAKEEVLGQCTIPLHCVEKRVDSRPLTSRWYNLEKRVVSENGAKNVMKLSSRIHIRISLDGGYHVLDELTQNSSDLRATARQLWKPSIGVLELGILNAQNLAPMKIKEGGGVTDAYCVAKYGQKWTRTRTILNCFNPKWNEQYTWEVFDPCTVITIGVFDNCHLHGRNGGGSIDTRIGKVRIRLSTLEMGHVYTHLYPLLVLTPSGVKKMGEIQLAVRFSCASLFNVLSMYLQPTLPELHYLEPLSFQQIEILRHQATQIVSARLGRSEPPLRREVVEYMLDVGSNIWSVRRSKAIHYRLGTLILSIAKYINWVQYISSWSNPLLTVIFHIVFLAFVCFPWLFSTTVFMYLLSIGIWNYRTRPRYPPYMDVKLSQADTAQIDELEEEFDTIPTSQKQADILKLRYDRLRAIASRAQTVFGDLATQGERLSNLLSWRDPRATGLFLIFCMVACVFLFVTPGKLVVVAIGLYMMRHPKFRTRLPSSPMNFLRRLPAKTDCLL